MLRDFDTDGVLFAKQRDPSVDDDAMVGAVPWDGSGLSSQAGK